MNTTTKIMLCCAVFVLVMIFSMGVIAFTGPNCFLPVGIAFMFLAGLLGFILYTSFRIRFKLIADCKQRLIDAKRQAFFGNWESALTKMRIVARESPVPLDDIGAPEDVVRFVREAARNHMRPIDGRKFYVG